MDVESTGYFVTDCFVMDCPTCGPDTYRVEGGVALGCLCGYKPPSIVIDCSEQ